MHFSCTYRGVSKKLNQKMEFHLISNVCSRQSDHYSAKWWRSNITRAFVEENKKWGLNINTKKTEYITTELDNEEKFEITVEEINNFNEFKYLV